MRIPTTVLPVITSVIDSDSTVAMRIPTTVLPVITSVIDSDSTVAMRIPTTVLPVITSVIDSDSTVAIKIHTTVLSVTTSVIDSDSTVAMRIPKTVLPVITSVIDSDSTVAMRIPTTVLPVITSVIDSDSAVAMRIPTTVLPVITSVIDSDSTMAIKIHTTVLPVTTSVIDSDSTVAIKIPTTVLPVITSVIDSDSTVAMRIPTTVLPVITSVIDSDSTVAMRIPTTVLPVTTSVIVSDSTVAMRVPQPSGCHDQCNVSICITSLLSTRVFQLIDLCKQLYSSRCGCEGFHVVSIRDPYLPVSLSGEGYTPNSPVTLFIPNHQVNLPTQAVKITILKRVGMLHPYFGSDIKSSLLGNLAVHLGSTLRTLSHGSYASLSVVTFIFPGGKVALLTEQSRRDFPADTVPDPLKWPHRSHVVCSGVVAYHQKVTVKLPRSLVTPPFLLPSLHNQSPSIEPTKLHGMWPDHINHSRNYILGQGKMQMLRSTLLPCGQGRPSAGRLYFNTQAKRRTVLVNM
ncbi:hypothetical protein J6590_039990 [Homalodisca vitripennis]|nr:hypothetical protein J6590_039990 [Homalodisca vitripennis]